MLSVVRPLKRTDISQCHDSIEIRAQLRMLMSLQAQQPLDVVTTQTTTTVSYGENSSSSYQDSNQNVTRVVQEVVAQRRRSLSLKGPSMVRTNAHI